LKERTDVAISLLDEMNGMDIDELKLKPREAKAVSQVRILTMPVFFLCHKHYHRITYGLSLVGNII
jgi:hypothetical protein